MKRTAPPLDPSLLAITAAGFAATVAQILLLRELLVVFYGNEMSTALVLSGWLLWTAAGSALSARLAGDSPLSLEILAGLLILQALGVPALVLFVRAARWIFGIPVGELATQGKMLGVCLLAPVLFAPIAGGLFGWCWANRRVEADVAASGRPLAIYLGEALGAALGGLVFSFLFVRLVPALTAAALVALALLGVAGWILWQRPAAGRVGRSGLKPLRGIWTVATLGVLAMTIDSEGLEQASRQWQWGRSLVLALDTPFHNIAVVEEREQVTVFANGLWMLTEPDPATAEMAVHPVLLQHPDPRRVLILGGGLAGQVAEVLKHPGIEQVDYIEQDPALISFVEGSLSAETRASLRDPRVRIEPQDAGTFLRRRSRAYDVVLMNVGEPINAQMNRFYTEESFRRLAEHLRPGGILSFSVPGGGDMVGPAHARLLGSLDQTLQRVFPAVRAIPGERARFFIANEAESLLLEPSALAARIDARGLDLIHVRSDTLDDLMNPMRRDYLTEVLADLRDSPINRQFTPVCYFHGVMVWAAQWHPAWRAWIERMADAPPERLFLGIGTMSGLVILWFWLGRPRYRAAVAASVLVQGAWGMVLQVVLILGFQILAGFAYLQLALILAFFMAGLAGGALAVALGSRHWSGAAAAVRWLAAVQSGIVLLPLGLWVFASPVAREWREGLSAAEAAWAFTAVSLLAGLLGGSHFSLAALASAATGARLERAGGYLYAIDLVGAAAGALLAGLLLLPLYGVPITLMLLSLLSAVCLVALLRRANAVEAGASP